VLRFDQVSKRYAGGQLALADVDFAVEAGELVFLTGHSGAGKSTVLKLISLIERPSRGAVLMDGANLAQVSRRRVPQIRRRIGMVFQDHRLLPERSVFDNVALPLLIAGQPPREIGKRVRTALEKVGLGERERALPFALSTGEQQRVGIARAIVSQPPLLIADEPTGNLDPTLSAEIMDLFCALPAQGTTVLIASHDLHLIKRLNRRVLVLERGQLIDDYRPGVPA
jgi:cell division transport system ATP-binding protein